MPCINIEKAQPGMILSKPVVNNFGIILMGEGTALTDPIIQKLKNMNISVVHIEGDAKMKKPKEEMLSEVEARFKKTEDKPYMRTIKKLLIKHIERLYD